MKYVVFVFLGCIFLGVLLFWALLMRPYGQIVYRGLDPVFVTIEEGSDVWDIAGVLRENRLLSSEGAFVFGAWKNDLRGKFRAGTFRIDPGLSGAEIAYILTKNTSSLQEDIRITFPEGWTLVKIADRLEANGFSGEEFLSLTQNPQTFVPTFPFLVDLPQEATLEGFLFPDTYLFDPESTTQEIIEKMLQAFEQKAMPLYEESKDNRSLFEVIILASIIEGEVRIDEERKEVSGIFTNRLAINMALQSDATLTYVMEEKKIQHGPDDLAIDSLYNTYKYPGLPPGPVSNPSQSAIEASLYPQETPYLYFLNDPKTGQTYFAKDFEEHKRNKVKAGL